MCDGGLRTEPAPAEMFEDKLKKCSLPVCVCVCMCVCVCVVLMSAETRPVI